MVDKPFEAIWAMRPSNSSEEERDDVGNVNDST